MQQPQPGHGIAKQEVQGIFVVNEMQARRVGCFFPGHGAGSGIVARVFDHGGPDAAQHRFFPGPGLGRHVDRDAKPQAPAENANGQPEIACGPDRQGMA